MLHGNELHADALFRSLTKKAGNKPLQLVGIKYLDLNSKAKNFSDSSYLREGLFSPLSGGRIAFCLQSEAGKTRFFYCMENCLRKQNINVLQAAADEKADSIQFFYFSS